MNASFYNGISGVKTQQFSMDVWANNIANVSTLGFRSATPEFSSLFSASLAGNYFDTTANDIGLGAQSQTTGLNLSQGILENTDRAFDLAISGEGWFGVQAQNGSTYFTRAGQFFIDANGDLVDGSGSYLMATSGGNITSTTLDQTKLDQFGKYYNPVTSTYNSSTPYAISALGDVALGDVGSQTKVNLPDYLYYPSEPTTYVNYQANLNPKVITETTNTDLSAFSNLVFSPNYPTASITGTLTNNGDITDLKEGDIVTLTLMDETNRFINLEATLDNTLSFSIVNANISKLDNTTSISIHDEIKVTQEIANVEHFTTDIIGEDGEKNILDMTFTKRVPQQSIGNIWDSELKILKFHEDYTVEIYNPAIHDATNYNIDLAKNQAVKKYDPTLYQIDTTQKKVYQIIDSQNGVTTFGGSGEILTNTMPTLSNSGTPLTINIGEPYLQESVTSFTSKLDGSNFIISGTISNLSTTNDGIQVGDNVAITMTDTDGQKIITSAKIGKDGKWSTTYTNYPLNTSSPTIEAHVVIKTGFEGMISNINLDKARVVNKDGINEGFLTNYGMDGYGNIIADFSNGRNSAIAKVALYHFQNDQGLEQISSTYFNTSSNSGDPIFYTNDNGDAFLGSQIYSSKLEGSNVSFATALTELIITQKAFDANAKCITTSDQLIQNAINMKRA